MRMIALAALLFWCAGPFAHAEAARSVGPEPYFNPGEADAVAPSLKLRAGAAARTTDIRLDAARTHERKALEEFNSASRRKVLQIGFRRLLSDSPGATFSASALDWTALPDGGHAAHFSTTSPDAAALRLGLAITRMDSGVELRFFGSADPGRIYGPVTNRDIHRPDPIYWTPVIEGETLTTEIYLAPGLAPASFAAGLPEVSHLVATASGHAITLKGIGDAGACEHDLACASNPSPALLATATAVARMVFTDDGGSYLCTGTLLNDSVPSTFVPYFYTANHCISTQTVANTLNTYWFFQALTCGAGTAPNTVQKTGGAVLLHHDEGLDDAFLQLNDAPPSGAVFAGWDAGLVTAGAATTALHHPKGDLKKLSLGNVIGYQPYNGEGSFIFAGWTYGVTEGGSSGSGLFTFDGSNYRLRGGLKGGTSSCDRPNGTDGYSRLDQVYPFIQQYLDPSAPVCSSTISPSSQSVAAAGATASVAVTNGDGCNWSAASNAPWLTIPAGSSGSGNGTVTYVVAPNTSASSRTGTLTIAGRVFTVTQAGVSGGSAAGQLVNPGFESGDTGWTQSSGGDYTIIFQPGADNLPAHTGSWLAWLGGYTGGTDKLSQDVAIPASVQQAYVQYWYFIGTQETTTSQIYDTIEVGIYSAATGARLATLAQYSNLDRTNGWVQSPQFDLRSYGGQTIRLQFTLVNDSSEVTNLFLDDVSLVTSGGAATTSVAASVLPSSRSVQVGATATVFATVINTGTVDAVQCGIASITSIPATFGFQATDPATNAPVGAANAKLTIPANQSRSFILSVTPAAPFASTDLQFDFSCGNAPNQAPLTGLNTLLISASAAPVPDIVALAASATPGVLTLPGAAGAGAFAVATVNVGATGSITATADTGTAALPITLLICQSNPATGACLAPPAAGATALIAAGATPTFSIFGTARGAIAFDPANARVFVRFRDGAGVTRGSTSVAVRTQ